MGVGVNNIWIDSSVYVIGFSGSLNSIFNLYLTDSAIGFECFINTESLIYIYS